MVPERLYVVVGEPREGEELPHSTDPRAYGLGLDAFDRLIPDDEFDRLVHVYEVVDHAVEAMYRCGLEPPGSFLKVFVRVDDKWVYDEDVSPEGEQMWGQPVARLALAFARRIPIMVDRCILLLVIVGSSCAGCGKASTPNLTQPEPANDVFAVGGAGQIFHYNGNAWTAMTSGITSNLHDVWGSSPADVYAVGEVGTILHYNAISWEPVVSGTRIPLEGVWGSGGHVFVVGRGDTTLHYDGNAWHITAVGNPGLGLWGVWGSSPSDVFAVGGEAVVGAAILHWNGSNWSPMASGVTADLHGVWGFANNVFAVGAGGTIVRYNGNSWSPMNSGTTADLWRVWGSSGNNVFATGAGGVILRYNGSTWLPMTSGTNSGLVGVWGKSGSDVFAVGLGGTILHFNGNSWGPMTSGSTTFFTGVWGPP